MSKLTPEKKAEYVKHRSGNCPFCGSNDIEGSDYNHSGDSISQRIRCLDCAEEWDDVYQLVDIDDKMPEPLGRLLCPNCGNCVFIARQQVRGTVDVYVTLDTDHRPTFLDNATKSGEMDTSGLDCDNPEPPFCCRMCGEIVN